METMGRWKIISFNDGFGCSDLHWCWLVQTFFYLSWQMITTCRIFSQCVTLLKIISSSGICSKSWLNKSLSLLSSLQLFTIIATTFVSVPMFSCSNDDDGTYSYRWLLGLTIDSDHDDMQRNAKRKSSSWIIYNQVKAIMIGTLPGRVAELCMEFILKWLSSKSSYPVPSSLPKLIH